MVMAVPAVMRMGSRWNTLLAYLYQHQLRFIMPLLKKLAITALLRMLLPVRRMNQKFNGLPQLQWNKSEKGVIRELYFSAITEKIKIVGENHHVSHVHRVMFSLHLHLIQITFPSCKLRAQSLLSVNLWKTLILKIQNPQLQVNVHPQILLKILVKVLQK